MEPPHTRLFVGIDGGGTRCRARIADANGRRLGQGEAGPANLRLGVAEGFEQMETAVMAAIDNANLPPQTVKVLHVGAGLAGFVLDEDRQAALAHPHPYASLTLETDATIACLGAHAGGDGAILILGTGSAGLVHVGERWETVGGWGFWVSDHGSGATLGRKSIRWSLWAHEQVVPATAFTRAIVEHVGGSPAAAVKWADTAQPRDYAAVAPLVFEHGKAGDPGARAILKEVAKDVATFIEALVAKGAPRVTLIGGVSEAIEPHLPESARAHLVPAQEDPLDGALRLARGDR